MSISKTVLTLVIFATTAFVSGGFANAQCGASRSSGRCYSSQCSQRIICTQKTHCPDRCKKIAPVYVNQSQPSFQPQPQIQPEFFAPEPQQFVDPRPQLIAPQPQFITPQPQSIAPQVFPSTPQPQSLPQPQANNVLNLDPGTNLSEKTIPLGNGRFQSVVRFNNRSGNLSPQLQGSFKRLGNNQFQRISDGQIITINQ